MAFDLYSNLPLPAPSSIRLLTIEPGYPEDDVYCMLWVVDRLEEAPEFEALSYACGKGGRDRCNIRKFELDWCNTKS